MKNLAIGAAGALLLGTGVATAQTLDWRYTDGERSERWSAANAKYAACDAGKMQSPIDLSEANALGDVVLAADYGLIEGRLKLGQHKVQVDVAPGQGMISGERLFNLVQVHFHTPAEHVMDGDRYPLVAHFVHATRDGTLGVLGVMFEEGGANEGLQQIINAMPQGDNSRTTVDMGAMVPDDLEVYRYMGSLTTPPCSEKVNWHVVEDVLEASPAQIATMAKALGMSARSIQPINNRLIVAPAD